jgi:DNA-binding CsgD family transcriptional regulator/tetratricopeptide (TPR) repeat protein
MTETMHSASRIGRRSQIDQVRGYVTGLAAGRGRALLVEGEPGIGKSTLMRTAQADATVLGCQVLWCTCEELSQAFPLLPLLDALTPSGPLAGYADAHAQIAEWLRAAAVPGNQVDGVGAAAASLVALIADMCEAAPVLLVVDDLQWADPATVMTLRQLFRWTHRLPLLVAGLARPVPRRDDLAALCRAVEPEAHLVLSGLSEGEVIDLVAEAVAGTPGERIRRLAAEAGGNPLYVRELIDAVLRTGTITVDGGQVEIIGGRPPASLPAAIADRLEFLSTPVREALRAAALLGVAFPVSSLAAISGQRVFDLMPVLDEAIASGVLCERGTELAFRHPLIRAALYEEMAAPVRAACHLDAARALAHDGAPAEKVARQLLPAVDGGTTIVDERLVAWLAGAANQLAGQAPNATVRLVRWALTGTSSGAETHEVLTCRLADALYRAGDNETAAHVAIGALAYVKRAELLVDLNWTLVGCRAIDGRREEALTALESALKLPGLDQRHHARLLVLAARLHRGLGRVERAEKLANDALAAATAAGDRWPTGWALGVLALVHGMRGEEEAALAMFERALAVADGDPSLADLRLMVLLNQAAALGDLDRYDDAIHAAEQACKHADASGNMVRLAQARSVLRELQYDVGRWDDALKQANPDEAEAGAGDPFVECSDHGAMATIRLHRGDPAAAQHLLDAQASADRLGDRLVGSLTLARSLEREQADAPAEALAILADGLSRCVEEIEQTTDLLADAVRLALVVGDTDLARDLVGRAETLAGTSQVHHRRAAVLHCRGLIDGDAAVLVEAAGLYAAAGRPLPQAQALEAAGVARANQGHVPAARAHFTDAYSVYSALGAEWDLARLQARFRAYGIRRGPRFQHRRSQQGWSSLTPSEVKVVSLVAKGMSNPQIAAQLFLSRRTVQTHVSHILAKLEMHSRTEIAREASRRDIDA